ncbi:MAG TPA: hypothetical protein VHX88_07320 [Solirubrobacteraceae bacterium]|nr:hypothetical protein [Solirubrobacteraceae bacterium]
MPLAATVNQIVITWNHATMFRPIAYNSILMAVNGRMRNASLFCAPGGPATSTEATGVSAAIVVCSDLRLS